MYSDVLGNKIIQIIMSECYPTTFICPSYRRPFLPSFLPPLYVTTIQASLPQNMPLREVLSY